MKIYLYSTLGCHLCEDAKVILWPLLERYQFQMIEIDIAESDELIERYGVRIPVVNAPQCSEELSWPFSAQDAQRFFAEISSV